MADVGSVPGKDEEISLEFDNSANITVPDISEDQQDRCVGFNSFIHNRLSVNRACTMKDFEKQVVELKKENFNLKLRIYFLEEQVQQKCASSNEELNRLNIELKVEVEQLKQDLKEKQNLLIKASEAVESLAGDGGTKSLQVKKDSQRIREVEDTLNQKIHLLEKEVAIAHAEVDKIGALLDQERAQRFALQEKLVASESQYAKSISTLEERDRAIKDLEKQISAGMSSGNCEEDISKGEADMVKQDAKEEGLNQNSNPKFGADFELNKRSEFAEETPFTFWELQEKLKDLYKTIIELQQQLKEREEELALHEKNAIKRDKTIQGLTSALKKKDKDNDKLLNEIDHLNVALAEARESTKEAQLENGKKLNQVIQEKELELQRLTNECRNIKQSKEDVEQKNVSLIKEKDFIISELQQLLKGKDLETDRGQEYRQLICTLKTEMEIYSRLIKSVKESGNLQKELDTIILLRRQLEKDIQTNQELRKILEEQIKAAKCRDNDTFSFIGDQTSYLSICLDHLDQNFDHLSMEELRKKITELMLLIKDLQASATLEKEIDHSEHFQAKTNHTDLYISNKVYHSEQKNGLTEQQKSAETQTDLVNLNNTDYQVTSSNLKENNVWNISLKQEDKRHAQLMCSDSTLTEEYLNIHDPLFTENVDSSRSKHLIDAGSVDTDGMNVEHLKNIIVQLRSELNNLKQINMPSATGKIGLTCCEEASTHSDMWNDSKFDTNDAECMEKSQEWNKTDTEKVTTSEREHCESGIQKGTKSYGMKIVSKKSRIPIPVKSSLCVKHNAENEGLISREPDYIQLQEELQICQLQNHKLSERLNCAQKEIETLKTNAILLKEKYTSNVDIHQEEYLCSYDTFIGTSDNRDEHHQLGVSTIPLTHHLLYEDKKAKIIGDGTTHQDQDIIKKESEGKRSCGSQEPTQNLLIAHLEEIHNLRCSLEDSIKTNDILHNQLEKHISQADQDKENENFGLSETLSKKSLLIESITHECEFVKNSNEKLQQIICESQMEIGRLNQELLSNHKQLARQQSKIDLQQQQLTEYIQLLQSLRFEMKFYKHLNEKDHTTHSVEDMDTQQGADDDQDHKHDTNAMNLSSLLAEIQQLRVQLECSIKVSCALHQKLKDNLSDNPDRKLPMEHYIKGDPNLHTEENIAFSSGEDAYSDHSADSSGYIPSRLVPGHRMWADKRGNYVLGLVEDYNAIHKKIFEGSNVLHEMEVCLDHAIHATVLQITDDFGNIFHEQLSRSQQSLEEAKRLMKLLWRVTLPKHLQYSHSVSQDEGMKKEINRLRKKLFEQEKKFSVTVKRLHSENQMKNDIEKVIMNQLALTHEVLKKARGNLEMQPIEKHH